MQEVWATLVVDRRRRHAGLDELDPSAVDDLVVRRGCDRYGPAEVMGDAEPHGTHCASTVPNGCHHAPSECLQPIGASAARTWCPQTLRRPIVSRWSNCG